MVPGTIVNPSYETETSSNNLGELKRKVDVGTSTFHAKAMHTPAEMEKVWVIKIKFCI